MELAREEREEFAELLAGLSPQQWESPSLCERWRVRDVVAHVISYDELDFRSLAARFAKGWFLQDRVNELGVADLADRTPEQLLELMRIHAEPSGLPAGFGGRIALVDGMIHQQDIRRPLAIPRTIPPRRLRAALEFARFAPLIRGAWRARGVKLVATDLDWSYGRGPQVSGSGEALLMAMAGRRDALGDLTGPGRSTFAAHVGA
ncbi:maleylpyruvate isomerase family mycothiol-dependent enzyme [Rhodococcus pseudokoreensis]|uniref:Maleylpyruvate isomerase family mycothiol-dependent enzyme n=1 Tax=Rhodococcus pseudokoreensis TaxID=2811421 RepID=A0A974WB30_9NOCA|nr:maleylpyruvate isomerase family mycothiol-dependent enzyme [Rhodococcus pseudokoreensis]QSE94384.1 maleylpyruvate isomerase family mycothiol-dependent enzyme [Rhodococcus pseudokoreensis]